MPIQRTLPNIDTQLDLVDGVGQRAATFRFDLIDGITNGKIVDLHPLRGATLLHDTTRTTKRTLNMSLGAYDTSFIDVINNRVDVYMTFANGDEYPLGRYMFSDGSRQIFTSGEQGSFTLNDEMFKVDQQITVSISGAGRDVITIMIEVLSDLGIEFVLDVTPFTTKQSWTMGTTRGQILESLALIGDFFSPWFGNDKKFHCIRSFDPITREPAFDFDIGNNVMLNGIVDTNELFSAPNRIIVVSNTAIDGSVPVVGTADVSLTAPHSIAKRGFVVADVLDLQIDTVSQANAVATNIINRQTVYEQVTLNTAPDPRHDSYDVIRWQGDLWLELGWSLTLEEGSTMTHTIRKAYV
jgi:hypothetical protein